MQQTVATQQVTQERIKIERIKMGKVQLVNKYENYTTKLGTKQKNCVSKCSKEDAEETDIYKCIEKYGMGQIVRQTEAMEPMYLDMTNMPTTIAESVALQNECEEYFNNLPSRVRKVFNDNKDIFYQKYIKGDYADFLTTGVLTDEMVSELKIDSPSILNPDLKEMEGDINAKMGENTTGNSSTNTDGNQSSN